jgi:hypothetical protein
MVFIISLMIVPLACCWIDFTAAVATSEVQKIKKKKSSIMILFFVFVFLNKNDFTCGSFFLQSVCVCVPVVSIIAKDDDDDVDEPPKSGSLVLGVCTRKVGSEIYRLVDFISPDICIFLSLSLVFLANEKNVWQEQKRYW